MYTGCLLRERKSSFLSTCDKLVNDRYHLVQYFYKLNTFLSEKCKATCIVTHIDEY